MVAVGAVTAVLTAAQVALPAAVQMATQAAVQAAVPLVIQGQWITKQSMRQKCIGPQQPTHKQQQQQQMRVQDQRSRAVQVQGSRQQMMVRSLRGLLGWAMTSHTC